MSEDHRLISSVTSGITRSVRVRSSTKFHLAHPAPNLTLKQRLIRTRPRLFLQLHRLFPHSRPEPVIDVLSSALVARRLAQKFPSMFKGRALRGMNDLLLIQSEDYNCPYTIMTETADFCERNLTDRDLLAVICEIPKDDRGSQGETELILSDGSVWVATHLSKRLYEFTTIDGCGNRTTARWVKRNTPHNSADFSSSAPGSTDFKYTFSIIDPNSRCHPIMGFLTQNTLEIPDFYTPISSVSKMLPSTQRFVEHDCIDDKQTSGQSTLGVDENLMKLIQVTGIWIVLREGLSPYFKYNGPDHRGVGSLFRNCLPKRRLEPVFGKESGSPASSPMD